MRCTFVVAAAAGLLSASAAAEDERLPFIIVMRNQVPLDVLRQAGGSLGKPDRRRNRPTLADQISRRTNVVRVIPDVRFGRDDFPVEPGGGPSSGGPDGPLECGVELIGAARVWNELGITGRGSVVCVIDSGDIEGFIECLFR